MCKHLHKLSRSLRELGMTSKCCADFAEPARDIRITRDPSHSDDGARFQFVSTRVKEAARGADVGMA